MDPPTLIACGLPFSNLPQPGAEEARVDDLALGEEGEGDRVILIELKSGHGVREM